MSDLSELLRLIKSVIDEHDECRAAEMKYKRAETWKKKAAARTLDTPDVSS